MDWICEIGEDYQLSATTAHVAVSSTVCLPARPTSAFYDVCCGGKLTSPGLLALSLSLPQVGYLDRFLHIMEVHRNRLQLVAMAAIVIAGEYLRGRRE